MSNPPKPPGQTARDRRNERRRALKGQKHGFEPLPDPDAPTRMVIPDEILALADQVPKKGKKR